MQCRRAEEKNNRTKQTTTSSRSSISSGSLVVACFRRRPRRTDLRHLHASSPVVAAVGNRDTNKTIGNSANRYCATDYFLFP
jgi:hypothetical protein